MDQLVGRISPCAKSLVQHIEENQCGARDIGSATVGSFVWRQLGGWPELFVAVTKEGDVTITPAGKAFAEADIPTRKVIFRDAALQHVTMLQQMKSALEKKSDHTMPLEFYRDILDERFSDQETERQVETLLNWGRYAEIFSFDSENDAIHLHDPNAVVSDEEALRHQ